MTIRLLRSVARAFYLLGRLRARGLSLLYGPLFGRHGAGFRFDPYATYTYATIFAGDHVNLGHGATMLAANSRIVLGSHVIFGPGVMVYAGNHNTGQQGRFMADVTEKRPEDDLEVVFEDDIWVGGGSIILQGVTVGRGSVIGAGSVVVRDVPPYCLVAGVPARPLKARWTLDGVIAHEALLYPINERLGREALSAAWQAAGLPGS